MKSLNIPVLSGLFLILAMTGLSAQTGEIKIVAQQYEVSIGEQKILLADKALGLQYFPDEGITVLEQSPRYRLLLTSRISSWLLEGDSLERLTSAKEIAAPGPKGSQDNGYIGVSAGWQAPAGLMGINENSWFVACHIEDQENLPKLAGGIPGFYARIALLYSSDSVNWTKLGSVISSQKPKNFTAYAGQGDRGTGEPGLCPSRDGKYLYLYYTEHSRVEGRGVQICMARADLSEGPPGPGSFRKLYNGSFDEPGLGGRDTPIITGIDYGTTDSLDPHVVYSEAMEKYIMVFNLDYWSEFVYKTGLKDNGMYISFSDDGIQWSVPSKMVTDWSVPLVGKSLSWVPTLVFDSPLATEGWLLYGYSPSWGFGERYVPHCLAGRRIGFRTLSE